MPKLDKQLELDRCPYCSVNKPTLESHYNEWITTTTHNGENKRFWGIYVCAGCGGVVTAASPLEHDISGDWSRWVREIYPSQTSVDNEITEPARSYLQQAIESLHAPAGAIMLCASAVDAMLKSKSYTEGKLYSRINKAAEDHLITQGMADWAHEVRLDANAQRHADNDVPLPNTKDAKRSLDFALALGELLFVLPEKVARGLTDASGDD